MTPPSSVSMGEWTQGHMCCGDDNNNARKLSDLTPVVSEQSAGHRFAQGTLCPPSVLHNIGFCETCCHSGTSRLLHFLLKPKSSVL